MTRPRPADKPIDSLPLDAIRVGKRYRQHMGDIDALAASIAEHGLLHPVVVTPERTLIAGERRLAAVRSLGWVTVPVTVLAPADLLKAEADENTVRLDFSPSEAVAIATALRPVVKAAARERMADGGKGAQVAHPSRADAQLAAAVGMGARTLDKASAVVAAAEADPEMGDLVADMDATGKVDAAYRALQRRQAPPEPTADYIDQMPPALAAEEREFRRRARWSSRIHQGTETLLSVHPEDFVALLDADERQDTERLLPFIEEWIARTRKALAATGALRVIGGSR